MARPVKRYRDPAGDLFHVRGVVDGRLIMRTWFRHRRRWHYVCATPSEIKVGYYTPDRATS